MKFVDGCAKCEAFRADQCPGLFTWALAVGQHMENDHTTPDELDSLVDAAEYQLRCRLIEAVEVWWEANRYCVVENPKAAIIGIIRNLP